jgi:hypothetical protein
VKHPILDYESRPTVPPKRCGHVEFWCWYVVGTLVSVFLTQELQKWRHGRPPDSSWARLAEQALCIHTAVVIVLYVVFLRRWKYSRIRGVLIAIILSLLSIPVQVFFVRMVG